MKIVSGSANKPLAEKIAAKLGLALTPLEIFIFPDGERRVRVLENVVEEDCIIIQPTNPPVDTNYIELFLIADALARSGARDITVVMPYMGYQRQDHVFRDGEAVSLEVMIKAVESLGANKIVSFDLHTIKIPEFFHIPITHLSALSIFAQRIKKEGWNDSDTVLVSPDMGGIRRIKLLSEMLDDMSYVTITKNRDLATGHVEAVSFEGTLKKRAIIVDDMISSGRTIVKAAELLSKNKVEEMYAFCTHPIFSAEAPKVLQESAVEKVFVTDGVELPKHKLFAKLEILSIADMIAKEIQK
ncbi:MAG TPA: ribose-phosphate pyrophosphokinase [Patescibacteria group bacterium]|nr:ribose-phosphate pyrophosphokinase [Patescibacteria group bacterium]